MFLVDSVTHVYILYNEPASEKLSSLAREYVLEEE